MNVRMKCLMQSRNVEQNVLSQWTQKYPYNKLHLECNFHLFSTQTILIFNHPPNIKKLCQVKNQSVLFCGKVEKK